jgi:signal transduction histidine kinase
VTRRLLVSYLAVTIIVLLVLEVPLGLVFRQRETDRFAVGLERDATALASFYEEPVEQGQTPSPAAAMTYAARTGVRVVVTDRNGISLVDSLEQPGRDLSTRPEIRKALSGDRVAGTRRSNTLGTDLFYVATPIASGGQVYGAVRLTLDTMEVRQRVAGFWLGLAGVAVVVLAAMALIGWGIARSVTRPLRAVEAEVARFGTGDLTTMPPDRRAPAEIAALRTTVNAMAQRLEKLLAEQRAFVADASHQLRTPLTALRLRLENLQSAAADPAGAADLEAAIDETTRLAGLVNDLLRLASAEDARSPQPQDLAQIARDRVEIWSAVADTVHVGIDLRAPDVPLMVMAVPDGPEQILDNLLDNAIAASAPGRRIIVGAAAAPPRHELTVQDEGPGLSGELKARALDRFWRADTSQPGSGLGLPIAKALAEASGGSLELADTPGGGLTVRVGLPPA